jgi:lipoate-protein ligase A
MDLQTRKLNFIQDFLKLESEKTIAQFEKLLRNTAANEEELKPMTVDEFHKRINKSLEDVKNGKVTDANDLLTEIEKWS